MKLNPRFKHERHVTTGLTSLRDAVKMAIKETSWLS